MTQSTERPPHWRYQPVDYQDISGDTVFGLCEVYLDGDGRLESWTENKHIEPLGESLSELTGDLTRMLFDAGRWRPVAYSDLCAGYQFELVNSPVSAKLVEAEARAALDI